MADRMMTSWMTSLDRERSMSWSLTFHGHVTSSMTSSFNPPQAISY